MTYYMISRNAIKLPNDPNQCVHGELELETGELRRCNAAASRDQSNGWLCPAHLPIVYPWAPRKAMTERDIDAEIAESVIQYERYMLTRGKRVVSTFGRTQIQYWEA